jgi:hypothetical protein
VLARCAGFTHFVAVAVPVSEQCHHACDQSSRACTNEESGRHVGAELRVTTFGCEGSAINWVACRAELGEVLVVLLSVQREQTEHTASGLPRPLLVRPQ